MNVLLYMAMSANGMIAGPNNEEDFLSHYNWQTLCSLAKEHGNFISGRRTYELFRKWEPEYFTNDITKAQKIVITSRHHMPLDKGYTLAQSPKAALDILEQAGHQTAVVTGGSTLNSTFIQQGLIDQIMLNVEGIIVGEGIPLFAPDKFRLSLNLRSVQRFEENGITLLYQVRK